MSARFVSLLSTLAVLFAIPAMAQQSPSQSPEVMALQNRAMQEINANLQCSQQVIVLQQQVQKLMADLAEAKTKPPDAK